ncbi:MAG: hypothetical protein COX63_02670 [Candidatus Diapherotrites archaeon CG_4_10_14_0_2_um_filter_31_5]|nr:MAG: hypothetical protein COX63_02670 [Candidatus Diapherotrites archaeon CG_4_10_14_0_2_um_filter_31_5]
MGLGDILKKKIGEVKEQKKQEVQLEGKYDESCALCGGGGSEKKWAGQYWHKKCMRKSRRMAKGMT